MRLTQIDGALPNLAIMKLASWHLAQGDDVHVTRRIEPDLFDPPFDRVYGSAIFSFSAHRVERFKTAWPGAIIGGTGSGTRSRLRILGERVRMRLKHLMVIPAATFKCFCPK